MRRIFIRLLTTLLVGVLVTCPAFAVSLFPDVKENTTYAEAIAYLSDLGIMVGDENGNFNPDKAVSRAEMAAIVCRLLTEDASKTDGTVFNDVSVNHWANAYIIEAARLGIVNGYGNGNFGPSDTVTYEQAVTMIVRAAGWDSEAEQAGGYPDGFLSIAAKNDLLEGINVKNGAEFSRANVAELIYNYLLKREEENGPIYLLNEMEPYKSPYHYNDSGLIKMGGQNYTHGFTCMGHGNNPVGNEIYFNLDGKYSLISLTAGIVSDSGRSVDFKFYADGELIYGFTMESGDLPTEHVFSIEGCRQLVMSVYDGRSVAMYSGTYGIADIVVTKDSDTINNADTGIILQDNETYLLSVMEPYKSPYHYNDSGLIKMGGQNYTHGFTCMGHGNNPVGNETYFNLGGKYKTLKFTAGIVSDAGAVDFSIYADGELIYSFNMESGALPTRHTVDISGCKQLVFAVYDGRSVAMYSGTYGIADIIVGE